MNNRINAILLLGLCLFCGCTTNNRPKAVVIVSDSDGNPISGAYEHPQVPFGGSRVSNANGRLKVWTNFPVIIKEGYIPEIVNVSTSERVLLSLTKADPSSTFEDRQNLIVRLAAESREKNALFHAYITSRP